MSQEQLTIASVTGVDVEFEIAGPGSRSYAFVIDWHIRFLLAIAWFFVALFLLSGGFSIRGANDRSVTFALVVTLPAAVIYLLYHPILELLTRGSSPGKRIAGVRIVTREGDTPSVGALLIRNVFRLIDSLPAFYLIGLVTTIVTRQHVRIGDMAAGTLLVFDHDRDAKSLTSFDKLAQQSRLDPRLADLVDELLQRWPALDRDRRRTIAAKLLSQINGQREPAHYAVMDETDLRGLLMTALDTGKA